MTRQVAQARQILAKLFNGDRLPFIPAEIRSMNSRESPRSGKLLIGHAKDLVSPTGFEPVLLP